jgi:coatomer subunit alpha
VKELIEIVREYILGLKMELKRKELRDEVTRQKELAAYFTNCELQRIHMRLVLSSAMALFLSFPLI